MALDLARGEHLALSDAALQGALPHARPGEVDAIRRYALALEA